MHGADPTSEMKNGGVLLALYLGFSYREQLCMWDFSPNHLCNMYVMLCMPMVPVWGFWSEFLWVVLS